MKSLETKDNYQPKIRFKVKLKRSIANDTFLFSTFKEELAKYAGVFEEDIDIKSVKTHCTIIDGFMDRSAIKRIFSLLKSVKNDDSASTELEEFKRFSEKFDVESIFYYSKQKDEDSFLQDADDEKKKETKKVYIFVHGWGGSIEETFGSFPMFLTQALGIETAVYGYQSGVWQKNPSIAFIARNLDNWIRNRFENHEIGILGHSLGGAVTRYLTVLQEHRLDRLTIKHVALLASPINGALLASIANKIPALNSSQLEELRPNSGFLIDLNERWVFWCRNNIPVSCSLTTMYALNDKVVNYTSAIGADPEAIPIMDKGHGSIVKPESKECEVVLTVARTARKAGLFSSD